MQPEIDDVNDRQRARQRRAEQVQRRRLALFICLLALIILIIVLAVTCSGGAGGTGSTSSSQSNSTTTSLASASYTAELTGDQSVPTVKTQAAATLTLTYDAEAKRLSFKLDITHVLSDPRTAEIYEGSAGEEGTAVYTLWVGTETGGKSGELASGLIVDQDLTGSLQGKTVADLIGLIKAGKAYVSIGNKSHPTDAIRGQITE